MEGEKTMSSKINTITHCEFCGTLFELFRITCMGCKKIGCSNCVKPLANAKCYPCYREAKQP